MGHIGIVPINAMEASQFTERLALCASKNDFSSTCDRRTHVARSAHGTLNSVRKQMFFNTLDRRASRRSRPWPIPTAISLAITDFDLYKTSHQFVFGDAKRRAPGLRSYRCIVCAANSTANGPIANLLFQRTLKEAVHDLGHALGLKHCFNARCAMYFSNSIYDTDNKLSHFCENCEKKVKANH